MMRTEQQQVRHKRKRKQTDFEKLIEKMERDGDYQNRVIVSDRKHDRRERRAKSHS
jgi:hypothetical protein